MTTRIITVLAFMLTCAGYAQHAGNYVTQKINQAYQLPSDKHLQSLSNRILTVEASALMNVIPNAQVAVFSMVQLGNTASEANELLESKLEPIREKLIAKGIKEDDIVIDMVSFIPRYETVMERKWFSSTFTEIPAGYELKKNLHIRYTDYRVLDAIISICAEHEVYDLAKIDYIVEKTDVYQKQMRDKITAYLGDKIAFYHNLKVDSELDISYINEYSNVYFPNDLYKQYTAYSSSSFEAVTKSKKDKTTVNSATKNTTFFYDPVNSRNFDLVINPGILQPTVQYTLRIQVSYSLPKEKENVPQKNVKEKEYLLVTPTGTIKSLPISTN